MKRITILSVFLFLAAGVAAQGLDYLLVYKPGKKKNYHYYIGDMIIIKPKNDFPTQRGTIYALSDSALYFSANDSILFSEFEEIVVKENTKPLSSRMWFTNFLVTTGSIAIWEVAWLVNSGKLSPDVKAAPGIIAFTTVTPVLVNQLSRIFVRGRVRIAPGDWKVGVVVMPKKQNTDTDE